MECEPHLPLEADRFDWRCSPLYMPDVHTLPPIPILTAQFDVLSSEGAALVQHLDSGGACVTHLHMPGVNHGFIGVPVEIEAVSETLITTGAWISRSLSLPLYPAPGLGAGL
ncbi:alpha/beta hydrolase [Devosia sp. MC532]|nr:alpha/beta hydrolase [Devosia sp. MC532]